MPAQTRTATLVPFEAHLAKALVQFRLQFYSRWSIGYAEMYPSKREETRDPNKLLNPGLCFAKSTKKLQSRGSTAS